MPWSWAQLCWLHGYSHAIFMATVRKQCSKTFLEGFFFPPFQFHNVLYSHATTPWWCPVWVLFNLGLCSAFWNQPRSDKYWPWCDGKLGDHALKIAWDQDKEAVKSGRKEMWFNSHFIKTGGNKTQFILGLTLGVRVKKNKCFERHEWTKLAFAPAH